MRVLMISTDRLLCAEGSAVRERVAQYAREAGAIDAIVFTRADTGLEESSEGALRIVPTHSATRWLYIYNAYRIVRRLPKPDVVTAQDPFEAGFAGWLIARHFRVPLHIQVHTDIFNPHFYRHSLLNRIRVALAAFLLRRAVRIRVVSERIAQSMPTGVPATVLPIYVDFTRFAALPRTKHPRFKVALLYVGRLEQEKRVDLAVRTLARARNAGHDAGLTIVGDGRESKNARALARSLGVEQFVEFVGRRDDIGPYLSQADAVLVPSVYEGYGLVIVEALAAGIPVIATDVGVAREAGAIVSSPDEFTQTLIRWIQSGPRTASLQGYPYTSREAYVRAYVDDLRACLSSA